MKIRNYLITYTLPDSPEHNFGTQMSTVAMGPPTLAEFVASAEFKRLANNELPGLPVGAVLTGVSQKP